MTAFLKDWEQEKKAFKANVLTELQNGGAAIPADFKKAAATFLKADTGMTPALKEVDAAFGKGHRKAVMDALTALHAVIEKTAVKVLTFAGEARSKSAEVTDQAASDALSEIHMAGALFNKVVIGFETSVAKELEKLQQAKSPTNTKIDIISLEGDMDAAVNRFKTEAKKYSELEKKFKTLNAVKHAEKAMQAYSKAAARTQVTEARVALEVFFEGVDDLVDHKNTIAKDKSKPDAKYIAAVGSLCDALTTIKSARGAVSYKNLKALEGKGN